MERLLRFIFNFRDIKLTVDDDYIDRLSRRHSFFLLIIFALLVIAKQYVGDPIHCWSPAEFTDVQKRYADSVCWVSSTYRLEPHERILEQIPDKKKRITYYQWVPLILLFQATLMSLPNGIWRILYKRSGINVAAILDAAIAGQRTSYADIRDKTIRYMVGQIERYLLDWRNVINYERKSKCNCCCCNRPFNKCTIYCCPFHCTRSGNYLSACYLFVKFLYVCNAIGQIFLLDLFFQAPYHRYGLKLVLQVFFPVNQNDPVYFDHSILFPRIVACYFDIRTKGGQLHRYVLQCVLPINLFNEKLFLFIWAWLVFVAVLSLFSFLHWFAILIYWPNQKKYVRNQLYSRIVNDEPKKSEDFKKNLKEFTDNYLRRDGFLVTKLISRNTGGIVAYEVLETLWNNFYDNRRSVDVSDSVRENCEVSETEFSRNPSVRSNVKKKINWLKKKQTKENQGNEQQILRSRVEELEDV